MLRLHPRPLRDPLRRTAPMEVACDRCDITDDVWRVGRRGWQLCLPCLAFIARTIQEYTQKQKD